MTAINKHEASIGSQNKEAGIIRHIFDVIGDGDKRLLEIGFGYECNSANLLSNYEWKGWLFDADQRNVIEAQLRWPKIDVVNAFLTVENVNQYLRSSLVPKQIDFLSIDIDGNDYWLWKAMKLDARLVVVEYNASFGPEESLAIRYKPSFDRLKCGNTNYHGASLTALTRLAEKKGYDLIGCESSGINAFYLKHDISDKFIPLTPEEAYRPHRSRMDWRYILKQLREYDLVKIE